MLWIGLTGAMGSGKSTVAKVLRQRGFPVLDADEVVHALLAPGGSAEQEVISTFGRKVTGPGGELDRRALGREVFGDRSQLARLEGILHPKVREEVARKRGELKKSGIRAAFYDVPLLFEKNMVDQFDHILVVAADETVRRERFKARMKLGDAEFEAREKNFVRPEIKERRASAVIHNNGSEADLVREIEQALSKIGL